MRGEASQEEEQVMSTWRGKCKSVGKQPGERRQGAPWVRLTCKPERRGTQVSWQLANKQGTILSLPPPPPCMGLKGLRVQM